MKIIKPGQIPQEKPIQHTCSHCGCIFEFMKHEIYGVSISCPTCGIPCYIRPTIIKRGGPRPWPPRPDERWVQPFYYMKDTRLLASNG